MANVVITNDDLAKCEHARSIIEKDFNHHTISEIAQIVGLNEFKLKVVFKLLTGETLYEHLTRLRIEKAKELLENTHLPLQDISSRIGIHKRNLTRQFKKRTGMLPLEWRMANRAPTAKCPS